MNTYTIDAREQEFKWEWFRHAEWFNSDVRENIPSNFSQAVTRILKESRADNCLEFLCGFGHTTRQLAEQRLNIIGFDYSASAIQGAKNLALQTEKSIPYFSAASTEKLKDILPHGFKAVISRELLFETEWHNLKDVFSQIFNILVPGGIFIFTGAADNHNFASELISKYDKTAPEKLLWSFRDGRTSCSKIMVKAESAADYRDYKYLYVVEDGHDSRLEVVNKRLPGYWNLKTIQELVYETGFNFFETRNIENNGINTTLNIACKNGSLNSSPRSYSEEEAYYDF